LTELPAVRPKHFSEFTVVPAERADPLPDEAGFDVGAPLGLPALTAHRALTVAEDGPRRLRPEAPDGRVVTRRAGAVGHAVIKLARRADATVISTISIPARVVRQSRSVPANWHGIHHVLRPFVVGRVPGIVDVPDRPARRKRRGGTDG
jgi:Zn-dependent alcohol dehydrogenase